MRFCEIIQRKCDAYSELRLRQYFSQYNKIFIKVLVVLRLGKVKALHT